MNQMSKKARSKTAVFRQPTSEKHNRIPLRMLRKATQVLGSKAAALHWFDSPLHALGGASPRECLDLHGPVAVERVLGRIEHGVFS